LTKLLARTVAGVFVFGLGLASAVHAGTAYVPLPGGDAVGAGYRVQIAVTNTSDETLDVSAVQLVPGEDGTEVKGPRIKRVSLGAGRTFLLTPEAGQGRLLSLSGSPALRYSARLIGGADAAGRGVELPVITGESLSSAEDMLLVQGLDSIGSRITDLVVVNLGERAGTCSAILQRADGSEIGNRFDVSLAPMAYKVLADVLAGQGEISEARATVSCSNDFYAYAHVRDRDGGRVAILSPASWSDVLFGSIDGMEKIAGLCAAGTASTVCTYAGPFTPTKPNPNTTLAISMFPPAGLYKSLTAHVEVKVTGWNPKNTKGAHGVIYIAVNKNKRLLANVFLRGTGSNYVYMRHGDCPAGCFKAKVGKALSAQIGSTYVFDYVYNANTQKIHLDVRLNGQIVAQLDDKPMRRVIEIVPKDRVIIGLSNPFCDSKEEPCSLGWQYSNVRVELFK